MTAVATRARRTGLVLAFTLFVLLGLPEGVLGTVWPSMRASLDRPVESLAWLVAGYTAGYFVSTLFAGRTQDRVGVGSTVALGVAATSVGLALYTFGDLWPLVVAAAFVLGCGGGTVDAALNGYLAIAHGARAMNMLHAMFGIGATGGPLLVTAALSLDISWRWVYGVLLAAEIVLLLVVAARRDVLSVTPREPSADQGDESMRWRVLAPMLAVFVFYVSVEASYGQWSYSVLTDERGVSDTTAGWAVAAFWGGLTAGRLALGFVGDRIEPERLLALSAAGMVAGSALFWWDPVAGVDLAALPLIGLAAAGVFPALVLLTPSWIGEKQTGRAVGYQLAASSVGVIATSAVLGALVRSVDLGVVAPTLLVLSIAMVAANLVTQRVASAM
ncbi:MAG: MFS transporter [Actinomycetota bacterium]